MDMKRTGLAVGALLAAALMTACSGGSAGTSSPAAGASTAAGAGKLTVGSILYSPDGYQASHGKAMEAYGSGLR